MQFIFRGSNIFEINIFLSNIFIKIEIFKNKQKTLEIMIKIIFLIILFLILFNKSYSRKITSSFFNKSYKELILLDFADFKWLNQYQLAQYCNDLTH